MKFSKLCVYDEIPELKDKDYSLAIVNNKIHKFYKYDVKTKMINNMLIKIDTNACNTQKLEGVIFYERKGDRYEFNIIKNGKEIKLLWTDALKKFSDPTFQRLLKKIIIDSCINCTTVKDGIMIKFDIISRDMIDLYFAFDITIHNDTYELLHLYENNNLSDYHIKFKTKVTNICNSKKINIITFCSNTGKVLVVPCNNHNLNYNHIYLFMKNAPKEVISDFFTKIAKILQNYIKTIKYVSDYTEKECSQIQNKKLSVFTHGLDIPWLHLKIEKN